MVNFLAYFDDDISSESTTFFLISTEENFRISTYMDLMRYYSYGEYTPEVCKAENTKID
ncbi:MAG: hypothetical protein IJ346_01655 [Clostridia bacterium]|nr:hypothetical protein [Clostridia bacterium]